MTQHATVRLSESQAVTHDFVNCLASVKSLSELLVDNPGLDSGDRSRFLRIIREETDRLVRLSARLRPIPGAIGAR